MVASGMQVSWPSTLPSLSRSEGAAVRKIKKKGTAITTAKKKFINNNKRQIKPRVTLLLVTSRIYYRTGFGVIGMAAMVVSPFSLSCHLLYCGVFLLTCGMVFIRVSIVNPSGLLSLVVGILSQFKWQV